MERTGVVIAATVMHMREPSVHKWKHFSAKCL